MKTLVKVFKSMETWCFGTWLLLSIVSGAIGMFLILIGNFVSQLSQIAYVFYGISVPFVIFACIGGTISRFKWWKWRSGR